MIGPARPRRPPAGLALLLLAIAPGLACGKPSRPAAPTAAAAGETASTGVLRRLEAGDRACYVTMEIAGSERALEGDFELCPGGAQDASQLLGRAVRYATRRDRVLAASCEGNPDCGKTDEVDLVVTIAAAR